MKGQEVISSPESELYYRFAVVAGDRVSSQKDAEIAGNVHSNGSIQLRKDSRVVGDVSAVSTISGQGTITGTVTEGADPLTLPPLPTEADMRTLADRVLEGDQVLADQVIDDILFVSGTVTLTGQLGGQGALLASGGILIKKGTGTTLPGSNLTLMSHGSILFEKDRHFRGVLRAGDQIWLRKNVIVEGVAIADSWVHVNKDSRITFLELDSAPPEISLVAPPDGGELAVSPTEIIAEWSDDFSGVDPSTASFLLDGLDRTADATPMADGITLDLADLLADGPHTVEIRVTDYAGREGVGSFGFEISSGPDVEPPALVIVSPADGAELPESPPAIDLIFSDAESGIDADSLRLVLDDIDLSTGCDPMPGGASCLTFTVPVGRHLLAAEIRDLAGNVATQAAEFTVIVPGIPPVIEITSPEPGSQTNAQSLTVAGTVLTTDTLTELTVNGLPPTLSGDSFELEIPVEEGFFEIAVRAVDGSGQESLEQVTIEVDRTAPELTILEPLDGSLSNVDSVRIRGSAMDESGFAEVTIQGTPVVLDVVTFETTLSLGEGTNSIAVVAGDAVGNEVSRVIGVDYRPALEVLIVEPPDQLQATTDTVTVRGTVMGEPTAVTVAGQPATLEGSAWSAEVPLVLGSNPIAVVAEAADGTTGKAVVTVLRDVSPPRIVFTAPRDGQVVLEPTLDVSGLINDIIGTVAPTTEPFTVTVNSLPAEVVGETFAVADLALQPGTNVLSAIVVDDSGNQGEASISVIYEPTSAPRLVRISGSGQSAVIGAALSAPLTVRALDDAGQPMAAVPVVFRVTDGDGQLDGGTRQAVVFTGTDGSAATGFQVGTRAGKGNHGVEATAAGLAGTVRFFSDAVPGDVTRLVIGSGHQQIGITGQPLPEPLVAIAVDAAWNPVPGRVVTFDVVEGGGRFENGLETLEVVTDAKGQAIASWSLGAQEGEANNAAVVTLGPAEPAPPEDAPANAFVASAMALGSGPTTVRGVVLDNTDEPVPGVTLSIAGMSLETTADSQGIFVLEGVPDGTLRLDVDGGTATRPGPWPHLEFIFQAIPGRTLDMPRPIYLLPLDTEGVFVSETEGGTLRLPELEGFELEVAPGSATFPDGSRSGVVSVTVVHNDKVPMIPSFYQQPRLVITVQPSGTLFDPPARLTLPNLDGHRPGEIVDFFSFDHDLARFVSIGPAQVTEDGTAVRSKPGFGIVEGGWHCGSNPSGTGTTHKCPECDRCNPRTKRCEHLDLCRGCGDPDNGDVCDGKGNCVVAVTVLPRICQQIGIDTSGPNPISRSDLPPKRSCPSPNCFAGIRLDFNRVTHMCNGADFKGAIYGESSFRLVGGTCPQKTKDKIVVTTGPGGRVVKRNRFESFRGPDVPTGDIKTICGFEQTDLSGPCTAIFEGDIFIGPCKIETRTITYTVGPTCGDFDVH